MDNFEKIVKKIEATYLNEKFEFRGKSLDIKEFFNLNKKGDYNVKSVEEIRGLLENLDFLFTKTGSIFTKVGPFRNINRFTNLELFIEGLKSLSFIKVKEEETCAICMEDIHNNESNKIKLSCGHILHKSCFRQNYIIYMKETCPLCRKVLSREDSEIKLEKSIKLKYWNKIEKIILEKNNCSDEIEIRSDFYDKIGIHFNGLNKLYLKVYELNMARSSHSRYNENYYTYYDIY